MTDAFDSDTPPPRVILRRVLAFIAGRLIIGIAGLLTGVRAIWSGTTPRAEQTLYFANHTSHGDFVLLWATLPPDLRAITRPVAGQDYWMASALRRFIGEDVFNALMIKRDGTAGGANPVEQMTDALKAGDSLIMFPEGTRNTGEEILLPLKSGLFHIARYLQQEGLAVRLVPVWIENLKRVLPKGQLVPVPLACSVRFGAPLVLGEGEDKAAFLARARQAMLDLRPEYDREDETELPKAAAGTEGTP